MDWEDDWFEDWDEGDQLDEEFGGEDSAARRRAPRVLALVDAERLRSGRATLSLRVPRAAA